MVQVRSLNCPNCGGSIVDTSKACSFCGSRVILSDDRQKFILAGTICLKCGFDNKEQHRFCSKCGETLFKECPICDREIGLDSKHCPACGENIDSAEKQKNIDKEKIKDIRKESDHLWRTVSTLNAKMLELQKDDKKFKKKGAMSVFWYPGIALIMAIPVHPILSKIIMATTGIKGTPSTILFFLFLSYVISFVAVVLYGEKRRGKAKKIKTDMHLIEQEMSKLTEEGKKIHHTEWEIIKKYRTKI
jgi:hypothetical protein